MSEQERRCAIVLKEEKNPKNDEEREVARRMSEQERRFPIVLNKEKSSEEC